MASQYAGWAITPEGYFAMGSGPLRAKARVERELYEHLGYAEDVSRGVLVLETRTLPTDDVAQWVAKKAGVAPDGLTFAVAPTASLAGGVQVVARVVETGLHKMEKLGFDVRRVVSAMWPTPPMHSSARRRPAARPPGTSTPASMTRAPQLRMCTRRRRTSARATASSASAQARSFRFRLGKPSTLP
jgi:methenyltetrahydromethanopterin cyclohydrolase